MNESIEEISPNCSVRYELNQTNLASNSVFDRYPQCRLQEKFMPTYLTIVRIFMLIWLISGIIGNLISFIIWVSKQQRRKNSSAIYLAALTLTDLILILFLINYDLERYWCVRVMTKFPGLCQIFQCLFIFTQYYSIILVFGFTLERYIAVCFPFKRHKLCTTKRALLAVCILALFVLGPMISQAILWTFENGECQMRLNVAMDNRFQTLLFVQEVIFSLVVPLATLLFNILVLCEMRRLVKASNIFKISHNNEHCHHQNNNHNSRRNSSKSFLLRNKNLSTKSNNDCSSRPSIMNVENKSRESSQFIAATLMLIILSFYLIACTVPTGIVYLIQFQWSQPDDCMSDEAIQSSPEWDLFFYRIAVKGLVDTFCSSHYACNFFIYFLTCNGFREHVYRLMKCKIKHLRTLSDHGTDTLILSRRTAPRSLHPRSVTESDNPEKTPINQKHQSSPF